MAERCLEMQLRIDQARRDVRDEPNRGWVENRCVPFEVPDKSCLLVPNDPGKASTMDLSVTKSKNVGVEHLPRRAANLDD